ncbi:DUF6746 family protein [Alishewanella jeotgali]|uniref:Soluble cytochrome b562 n=1 Tax=Alishewanella jeotgali KCTC 22429 TaxID=1129374 RepID=H3ZBR9_9ALTE|nr:DUF6746 family protein [Alishewanella jeotgali]EHR42383.1 hypothetical protein AJE_03871 [Alishewanella jeotgali KCTC 22429]
MKSLLIATLVATLSLTAQASERPAHFKGAEISSAQQALSVLQEQNSKLAALLAGELNPTSMTEIHQLTYTLENALAKLPAASDEIKEVLEEVHQGSETMDYQRVKDNGAYYLQLAKALLK